MDDEMEPLMKNQIWDLVEVSESVSSIVSGSTGWRRRMRASKGTMRRWLCRDFNSENVLTLMRFFSHVVKFTPLDPF